MEIIATELAGVHVIRPCIFEDARGSFVKTYHAEILREAGLAFQPREEFFSVSRRNVIRGLHVLMPPHKRAWFIAFPAKCSMWSLTCEKLHPRLVAC